MKTVRLNFRRCLSILFGLKGKNQGSAPDCANPFHVLFDRMPDPVWSGFMQDVTAEQRYCLLAENATDCIAAMNLDGRFTYVSPAVLKLRGYSVEEVMGQVLDDTLAPAGAAAVLGKMARNHERLSAGLPLEAFRGDYELTRKEGSSVWADVSFSPMSDAHGETVGYLVVSHDISERKAMETELQSRTDLLEAVQGAARIGYFVTDLRTGCWNSSAMLDEIMGIDERHVPDVDPWSRLVHPDDRQRAKEEYEQAIRHSAPLHHHYRIIRPSDGHIGWLDARVSFEFENDQPVRLIGTVQDITGIMEAQRELERHRNHLEALVSQRTAELSGRSLQLEQASERLQLAMEATHHGIWEWNLRTMSCTEQTPQRKCWTTEPMSSIKPWMPG